MSIAVTNSATCGVKTRGTCAAAWLAMKKLSLKTETIRVLSSDELHVINGGARTSVFKHSVGNETHVHKKTTGNGGHDHPPPLSSGPNITGPNIINNHVSSARPPRAC
jgi:hypothetical protein